MRRVARFLRRHSRALVCAAAMCAVACALPSAVLGIFVQPPSSLTVAPGDAAPILATLNWDPSPDASVVSYRVYAARGPLLRFWPVVTTSETTYDFTQGTPGVPLYFRVTAVDGGGTESTFVTAGPVTPRWNSSPHVDSGVMSLRCVRCHFLHGSGVSGSDVVAGANPFTGICLRCHSGSASDTANVMTGSENSFGLASGHSIETSSARPITLTGCGSCHAAHVSSASAPMLTPSRVNGVPVGAPGPALCMACHDDAVSWFGDGYPSTSAPTRDSAGFPTAGTWPGPGTYLGGSDAHRLIPATTQTVGVGEPVRRAQGDCLYCHAAHRGPGRYDSLIATFSPSTSSTVADDQSRGDYAAVCLACHGDSVPSGFSTGPVDIAQFVTTATASAGHRVMTAGGTLPVGAPLPCYECHNPHGSTRSNASMISDERGADLETSSSVGVRHFCLTCHTTSDSSSGWDTEAGKYAPVVASDTIVGLRRDGVSADATPNALRLPDGVPGHAEDDTFSCYDCHGTGYAPGAQNVHDPAMLGDLATAKHSVTLTDTCGECHQDNIQSEHLAAGKGCGVCHGASASQQVKDAVSAGQTDCSACHDSPHALDAAFCYGCHTDARGAYPGQTVAQLNAHTTATSGTWNTGTSLPGVPYSIPSCAACHQGHRQTRLPTQANQLCYGCHTLGFDPSYYDPWDFGGAVPFRWLGKAVYEKTSHGGDPSYVDLLNGTQLAEKATTTNTVLSSNSFTLVQDRSISDGLSVSFDRGPDWAGSLAVMNSTFTTSAGYNRYGYPIWDGIWGVGVNINLGSAQWVSGGHLVTGYGGGPSDEAQVLQVLTSDDGVSWTSRGIGGTYDQPAPDLYVRFTQVRARWVRFMVTTYHHAGSNQAGNEIDFRKGEVLSPVANGTWTSGPRDVSMSGLSTSATVSWSESRLSDVPETVSANVSLDRGTTWSGWQQIANGGGIPGLASGVDLSGARVAYRFDLGRNVTGDTAIVYGVTTRVSRAVKNAATVFPGSGASRASCLNCHEPHGTAGSGDLRVSGNDLCYGCHDAPAVTRDPSFRYEGRGTFESSGHAAKTCVSCHSEHGWPDPFNYGQVTVAMLDGSAYNGEYGVCMTCHNSPANSADGISIGARLSANSNSSAHHDLSPGQWSNTRLQCSDCHNPHTNSATSQVSDPDTGLPYSLTVGDPFSKAVTLFPDKDVSIWEYYRDTNRGLDGTASVRDWMGNDARTLMHFPMDAIPATWTITSAKLVLRSDTPYYTFRDKIEFAPMTADFQEGTGGGDANNNWGYRWDGATWAESQPGTFWQTPGGDFDSSVMATYTPNTTYNEFDITAVVNAMRANGNHGLMVAPASNGPGTDYTFWTREGKQRPQLKLTFAPSAARAMVDSADLCMKCHDGNPPRGVRMGATGALAGWATDAHGGGVLYRGSLMPYEAEGDVRAPFTYDSAPLACDLCHDAHGSSIIYHLKERVGGGTGVNIQADGTGAQQWCEGCHVLPWHASGQKADYGYDPATYNKCFTCHRHGSGF